MCYTKCSEVPGSGKGKETRKSAKVHVLDFQLPCLRCLVPSNSVTDGLSSIFQDPPKDFLRKTRAGHVTGPTRGQTMKDERDRNGACKAETSPFQLTRF